MCKQRVDQHLIVLNLYSISFNKIQDPSYAIYECQNFTESKFDAKYANVFLKVIECLEKENTRMNAKHSIANRLLQNKTNE